MALKRIGIVGAGLIGLAVAIKLKERLPGVDLVIWDKEPDAGRHQSTHNSGVLHAGLYYKPGSLKAKLSVEGIREMTQFCQEHRVPHEICGKIVLATEASEIGRLNTLYERGLANGLRGIRKLHAQEIKEMEPCAQGVEAVHVPEEGIVDYAMVVQAMKRVIEGKGSTIRLTAPVRTLSQSGGEWRVGAGDHDDRCDFLVNCGGLHSDRVARLAGENPVTKIVPFRGEYFHLRESARRLVRNLIYPVPDPTFPFLGVHFTRLIQGGIEAGPNAVLAMSREGYSKGSANLRDAAETLAFPGIWRFLARHRKMCWQEVRRSLSKGLFCTSLQRLVPELTDDDLITGGSGVRAQAMQPDGELVQDFEFIECPKALHVINTPSPGATASLAIGKHIAATVCRIAGLQPPGSNPGSTQETT